jgi:hypothetical protein
VSKIQGFIVVALALAGSLWTGGAQARDNVYWSIGIHAPLDPYGASIGTTISNARPVAVYPAPVYVAPAPAYYYPPPPRVVYRPVPVYVEPAPVYMVRGDGWRGPRHKHWKKHHRHWRD